MSKFVRFTCKLEEYIISINEDELDQLHPDYREKMLLMQKIEEYCFNNRLQTMIKKI